MPVGCVARRGEFSKTPHAGLQPVYRSRTYNALNTRNQRLIECGWSRSSALKRSAATYGARRARSACRARCKGLHVGLGAVELPRGVGGALLINVAQQKHEAV